MPKITLDSGVRLHYQRMGRGPDLVMAHGLTGNLSVWHLKIVPLLTSRFRVLTYDLRGHGFSDMPPTGYSATAMSDDLLGLLDALDIDRPSVVGHSFGADIALYFAYRNPERVRRVVAIESGLPALCGDRTDSQWEGWDLWSEVLRGSGIEVPPERRNDAGYLIRQTLKVPKKWGPLKGLPRDPEPFLRLLDTTSLVRDYTEVGDLTLENLGRLHTPVHLVYAEGSAFAGTMRSLLERLPDATPVLLPKTEWGHFGPLEQPEVVAERILAALDGGDDLAAPALNGAGVIHLGEGGL